MPDDIHDVEQMLSMIVRLKCEHRLFSVQLARASDSYFDWPLSQRKEYLGAPSTFHLCKTIIMQNKKHDQGLKQFPSSAECPFYPKNICVISQFEGKIQA